MVKLFKMNNFAVGAGLAKSEALMAAILGRHRRRLHSARTIVDHRCRADAGRAADRHCHHRGSEKPA